MGSKHDKNFQYTSNVSYSEMNIMDCQNLKINPSYVSTKDFPQMSTTGAPVEEILYDS